MSLAHFILISSILKLFPISAPQDVAGKNNILNSAWTEVGWLFNIFPRYLFFELSLSFSKSLSAIFESILKVMDCRLNRFSNEDSRQRVLFISLCKITFDDVPM